MLKSQLSGDKAVVVPEVQVPDFKHKKPTVGRRWGRCTQCKEQVLIEVNGKQYYHRLKCKLSNGIAYSKDRP